MKKIFHALSIILLIGAVFVLSAVCFRQYLELSNYRAAKTISGQNCELKLTLEISDIDYSSFAAWVLSQKSEENASDDFENSALMDKLKGASAAVVTSVLDMFSQEDKNQIAVYLINAYRETFIRALEEFADNNNLSFHIDGWVAEAQ